MGTVGLTLSILWIIAETLATMLSIHIAIFNGQAVWRWKNFFAMLAAWCISFSCSWWIMSGMFAPIGIAVHIFVAGWLLARFSELEWPQSLWYAFTGLALAAPLAIVGMMILLNMSVIGV